MKVFIVIDRGTVCAVYSDSNKVEAEIIDLDERNSEKEAATAEKRAEEVAAFYAQVA